MRLHIRMFDAEEFLHPLDRQALDDVCVFAAAIVTTSGIALGILVCEDRSGGFKDGLVREVFRCDQFQSGGLALLLILDGGVDFRVELTQWCIDGIQKTPSKGLNLPHVIIPHDVRHHSQEAAHAPAPRRWHFCRGPVR